MADKKAGRIQFKCLVSKYSSFKVINMAFPPTPTSDRRPHSGNCHIRKKHHYGPCLTWRKFNEGVVLALKKTRLKRDIIGERDYIPAEKTLPSGSCENQPDVRKTLTHGDLNPKNIIVENDKITGIIDWGLAGCSIDTRKHVGLRRYGEPLWREHI